MKILQAYDSENKTFEEPPHKARLLGSKGKVYTDYIGLIL